MPPLARRLRKTGWDQPGWLLLMVLLVAALAARGMLWLEDDAGRAPAASVLLQLLAAGCAGTALLRLPAPRLDRAALVRLGLDAALISLAVTLVGWALASAAAGNGPTGIRLATAGALLRAGADVGLASSALVVLSRLRHPGGPRPDVALLVCGGGLALGIGDLAVLGTTIGGHYRPGHPVDASLVAAGGLVLAGAWRHLATVPAAVPVATTAVASPGVGRERVAVSATVLPAALAALAVLTLAFDPDRRMPNWALAAAAALGALLLTRLVVAMLDQLSLAGTLESRVTARTLELLTREQWFRSLVQHTSDVLTVVDGHGVIRYQSPAVSRLFGYDPASLTGSPLSALLRPPDARHLAAVLQQAARQPRSTHLMEFAVWHRNGHWCETETVITSLVDEPDIRGLVLNTRDVSERKQLQDRLTHRAYHDTLTGLANRALFQQRLAAVLERPERNSVGVLFCDLDGFKAVNDSRGHHVGDALLVQVAERLRGCVRQEHLVARFGGDAFAVLVCDRDATRAARELADRISRTLRQAFAVNGKETVVGVSVGIAVAGVGGGSPEVLLRNADLAMYRAKASRDRSVVVFEPAMHDALLARLEVEDELREAVGRAQLVLHYQPTVDLATGRFVGAEALMRWYHPDRGLLQPDEFISVAEDKGYIDAMGQWALHEACRQGRRWQEFAPQNGVFEIGVNVSTRQVTPRLVKTVQAALEASGLPPPALVLEITESVLVEHAEEALGVLRSLKQLGVRLAIDDFGTGYSSLSYLSRFPLDVIKVDKQFVQAVVGAGERAELAATIVRLGSTLHLTTVAEGIENWPQCHAVRQLGCRLGQGYLFSRPLPAPGVTELLTVDRCAPPAVEPSLGAVIPLQQRREPDRLAVGGTARRRLV